MVKLKLHKSTVAEKYYNVLKFFFKKEREERKIFNIERRYGKTFRY